jgi:hypothetical protein
LNFVMPHLVTLARGEQGVLKLNRRTIPYRDLISSPKANNQRSTGAKGLVDRFIKEGLLSATTYPEQEVIVSITHDTLIRRWPRVWRLLAEDLEFLRMRDRLDARQKLWLIRYRCTDDLLRPGTGLAEAETLLRDFRSSLSENQIDYIQKSLAKQRRRRHADLTASERNALESRLKKAEEKARLA